MRHMKTIAIGLFALMLLAPTWSAAADPVTPNPAVQKSRLQKRANRAAKRSARLKAKADKAAARSKALEAKAAAVK